MFEQTFKNIDDILYKDSGADSELDYIGQTSWVMFLRYLDELEQDKSDQAALQGKPYKHIIDEQFRWTVWAMPKIAGYSSSPSGRPGGALDHHKAMTGPDLVQFVDLKLFPYLANFKLKHSDNPQTIEYKIGEIFSELKNKIQSGYNLREILDYADELPFRSTKDKHELSHLYESKIKNMGNAGRNGGQYYTPRPLIRAMIEVVKPKIGERIYDGACGSGGFLCEAFEYLTRDREKLSTTDLKTLQEKTFYGKEKKNLAYIIGVMNMILHGIEAPNIIHTNTLSESIRDIQEKDRYHVILANPPFGGNERPEVQQNFDIKSSETAFLFLQHFIKNLKAGGRAGVVIKNTFLSNADNAAVSLRKYLLENCNLHTVLDLPGGTFVGAGVKTVVLFFEKGEPTKKIWYYQLDPGRNMGKTNPLNDEDMNEFTVLQKTKPETKKSWNLAESAFSISNGYDLSVRNPNLPAKEKLRNPDKILEEIISFEKEENRVLESIKLGNANLNIIFENKSEDWVEKKLGEVCNIIGGGTPSKANDKFYRGDIYWATVRDMKEDIIKDTEHKITQDAVKNSSTNIIPKGNVIIATRVGLGKVCLIEHDTAINQDLRGIVPIDPKVLSVGFLYRWFKSISHKIVEEGTGATVQGVKLPFIKSLSISIPPLKEQKNIVHQLDIISTETKNLENIYKKKFDAVEELKKSILQKAFSGELSEMKTAATA